MFVGRERELKALEKLYTSDSRNCPSFSQDTALRWNILMRNSVIPDAFLLSGNKNPIEPKTLQNKYKNCLKDCNIPYINFHTLRHTFATRCVEVGFDIKSLSEILGHSSVGTTANIYSHLEYSAKVNSANKIAEKLKLK